MIPIKIVNVSQFSYSDGFDKINSDYLCFLGKCNLLKQLSDVFLKTKYSVEQDLKP